MSQTQKEAAQSARVPAPDVVIHDPYVDERAELIRAYASKDPDSVYAWQSGTVTTEVLERKAQQVVRDSTGRPVTHGGDVLVKMPKEVYAKWRAIEAERSLKLAQRIDPDGVVNLKKKAVR